MSGLKIGLVALLGAIALHVAASSVQAQVLYPDVLRKRQARSEAARRRYIQDLQAMGVYPMTNLPEEAAQAADMGQGHPVQGLTQAERDVLSRRSDAYKNMAKPYTPPKPHTQPWYQLRSGQVVNQLPMNSNVGDFKYLGHTERPNIPPALPRSGHSSSAYRRR